ncbi:MAG: hypothetical protein R3F65_10645 [bacterium]|nr:hypothetical protein [Myxococcales bacterium]
MNDNPFTGLPDPEPERLTLYGFGPGFGESLVLHLPDGLWMVVDGCVWKGINLPLALLDHFGQQEIDLLAVTHPDEDHIRGLDELLYDKHVHTVWRYPFGSMVRDFLALQLERSGPDADERLRTLFDLHEAFYEAARSGAVEIESGGVGTLTWTGREGRYEVVTLAPTTYDTQRMRDQFDHLIDFHRHGIEATERMLAFLRGDRRWSDRPNSVSLAMSVRWGDVSLILGGDVENGCSHLMSGWKGILRRLTGDGRRRDRRALLRDPSFVKVAHHGSGGSHDRDVWALHAHSGRVPLGLIMPFDRHRLPDLAGLLPLRDKVDHLMVTSRENCSERLIKADWRASGMDPPSVPVPMVVVEFSESGDTSFILGGDAAHFTRP